MDITGRIIAVLPERSGVSQRNGSEWKVATYVLETQEQYPRKMCFEVFGSDRIQQFNIQVGEMLAVSFDIDAHEYNGRWFNTIRAFRVSRDLQQPVAGAAPMPENAPMPNAAPAPTVPFGTAPAAPDTAPFPAGEGGDSDLPF